MRSLLPCPSSIVICSMVGFFLPETNIVQLVTHIHTTSTHILSARGASLGLCAFARCCKLYLALARNGHIPYIFEHTRTSRRTHHVACHFNQLAGCTRNICSKNYICNAMCSTDVACVNIPVILLRDDSLNVEHNIH